MRAGSLTAFLLERIAEEELLADAFNDEAAAADCRNRRCAVQQGGRTVLRLLGSRYIDHQDCRYRWMMCHRTSRALGKFRGMRTPTSWFRIGR